MNPSSSSMFAPLGSNGAPAFSVSNTYPPVIQPHDNKIKTEEQQNIDRLREEKDLIDLTNLKLCGSISAVPKSGSGKLRSSENGVNSTGTLEPQIIKEDSEKKQQNIKSTLDQKKKDLQKQRDTIEHLNRELQKLDIPATTEMSNLRAKIETIDRATKWRKQKEMELLHAIEDVSRLADEKCALTEQLKTIMYDFESVKQKRLKELEDEMGKVGV